MILVDSDILIEVIRGRDKQVAKVWEALGDAAEVLICSPVTVAELWHGVRRNEREALARFFRAVPCLPIDEHIGRRAGDYLAAYHRSHSVHLGDALIAATASIHDAELWTRNRKHYPMPDIAFFMASPL